MKIDNEKHGRRSIRLQGYDYSQEGAYFVTICTQDKKCIFGDVENYAVRLNEYGMTVENEWMRTSIVRPNVELDEFIVMPNHFHGILIINRRGVCQYARTINVEGAQSGNDEGVCTKDDARICRGVLPYARLPYARIARTDLRSPTQTIGSIVRGFKSSVAKQINAARNTPEMPVWHRNYYEHVIRNENDLDRIRQYIVNNPLQWESDDNNPANKNIGRGVCNTPVRKTNGVHTKDQCGHMNDECVRSKDHKTCRGVCQYARTNDENGRNVGAYCHTPETPVQKRDTPDENNMRAEHK